MCVVRGADSSYTHTHTHTWPIMKLAAIEMFPYIFAHAKKCLERIHTQDHTHRSNVVTHTEWNTIFFSFSHGQLKKKMLQCCLTHTHWEKKFSFCFKLKKKKCRVCEVKKCIIFVFFYLTSWLTRRLSHTFSLSHLTG